MNSLLPNPRTHLDHVFNAMVQAETRLGRAVSRWEVSQELERTGILIRSLDGLV